MTADEHDIPTVFLCYARHDDKTDDGRITELRQRIEREVQAETGEPFKILQDTSDILVGTPFRAEIEEMLDQVTALVVIVTPSLLKSPNCRSEIQHFRQRAESDPVRLPLFPILYRPTRELEDESDVLAAYLKEIEYANWCDYRFHELASAEMRQEVSLLAIDISSVLRLLNENQQSPIDVVIPQEAESPGFVERMAELEDALPKLPQSMDDFTAILSECNEVTSETTSEFQAAARSPKPAAARLRIIHQLRQRLEDPASQMEDLAGEHKFNVAVVGRGMDALISGVRQTSDEEEVQQARVLLESLSGMVGAAEVAHDSVRELRGVIANTKNLSSTLRPVYGRIDRALGTMFPGVDEFVRWRDGLEDALGEHP